MGKDKEFQLEEALLEYVELYGLTSKARELFRGRDSSLPADRSDGRKVSESWR